MTELQRISGEICEIFQSKIKSLSEEQAENMNLRNNSMNFCIELGDEVKAIWEAQDTLEYLKEITK